MIFFFLGLVGFYELLAGLLGCFPLIYSQCTFGQFFLFLFMVITCCCLSIKKKKKNTTQIIMQKTK